MTSTREQLIRKNENYIQIPMPDLNKMTNEDLEKRASMFEKIFEIECDDDIEV